jgi:hypothetical protein
VKAQAAERRTLEGEPHWLASLFYPPSGADFVSSANDFADVLHDTDRIGRHLIQVQRKSLATAVIA